MSMNNKCLFTGRLGKDASEPRETGNGGSAINFSLAISEKWTAENGEKKEHTEWISCAFFGKRAKALAPYLTKGTLVSVEGKWRTRKRTDKNGVDRWTTECHVRDIELRGGGKRDGSSASTGSGGGDFESGSAGDSDQDFGDIPFLRNETVHGVYGELLIGRTRII